MLNEEEEAVFGLCVTYDEHFFNAVTALHWSEVQVRLKRKNKGKRQRSSLSPTFALDLPQGHRGRRDGRGTEVGR